MPGGFSKSLGTHLSSTMNTSSVHLRDLNNLVSALPCNGHLGCHYTKDPSDSTRLRAIDSAGASSYEEDRTTRHATTFSSKISCPTISQRQSIFDKIKHQISGNNNLLASETKLIGLPFGEQGNFNGTELGSLDSSSVTEADLSETQNGKNPLHLISELCDQLAASDSAEKGKHDKATQTEKVDTPDDSASQRLYLNNQTYFSYATPHSQTNIQIPVRVKEISTALVESPYGSYSCALSDSHILMPNHNNDAIENGYEDFLSQCHEPYDTCCEPAAAVSCLEHMIERITPPLSCATPVDDSYKPNEQEMQCSNGLTNSSSGR